MYQTLTVSEKLYRQLETTARHGGFDGLKEFIQICADRQRICHCREA
jgi:hypothetical protein